MKHILVLFFCFSFTCLAAQDISFGKKIVDTLTSKFIV